MTRYRMDGQKMAIDPNNPNVVYVGTTAERSVCHDQWRSHLAKRERRAGSRRTVSGVYPGITGIVFDPELWRHTGGNTNTIFAASYGNGVYESTNAGASWSSNRRAEQRSIRRRLEHRRLLCGRQRQHRCGAMQNGTWTELLPSDSSAMRLQTVAVDPFNPNEIVATAEAGRLKYQLQWRRNLERRSITAVS